MTTFDTEEIDGPIVWVELCEVCDAEVETMCFKGTGICSENCRKRRDSACS